MAAFANNTFKNPVETDSGDSYAFEDNGWYYLYLPDDVTGGGNVNAYKSQNLIDWTSLGTVYTNVGETYNDGSTNKTPKSIWAPEVHKINGKYYLICVYVTNTAADNDKDIVVIEGTSPTTFDPATRTVMLGNDAVNDDLYIDPTLFVDTNGSLYMYYKYKLNGVSGSAIQGRPMSDPFTFSGSAVTLQPATGNHEHPYMDVQNGHYILFWSSGIGNQTSYKINYATSTSPTGTFTEPSDSPIMQSWQTAGVIAPGATSVVRDGAGDRWMVYRQKVDSANGWTRVVCANKLEITDTGDVSITPTRNTYVRKPVPLTGLLPADDPMTRVENTDSSISYTGTWTLDSNSNDSGGSSKFAKNAGNKAEFTFYGDSIRVGIRTGINSGKADIRLDGTLVVDNVDTYSSASQYQQIIYENDSLTLGTHTISFEATGTRNSLSGANSVRLDYFEYH
jgi:hypothetical protein